MEVQLITSLQQRRPLVLAVTNFITAGAVANCLSAAGMSPLMPSDPAEAAELVALADAVVVNIGSVGREQAPSYGPLLPPRANSRSRWSWIPWRSGPARRAGS